MLQVCGRRGGPFAGDEAVLRLIEQEPGFQGSTSMTRVGVNIRKEEEMKEETDANDLGVEESGHFWILLRQALDHQGPAKEGPPQVHLLYGT